MTMRLERLLECFPSTDKDTDRTSAETLYKTVL